MTSFHMGSRACLRDLTGKGRGRESGLREDKENAPVKCSEPTRRREASCRFASRRIGVHFARPLVAFALLAVTYACGSSTGSVGAVLGKNVHTGRLFVREVPPGMAAAVSGLR